jgi:hypothetical protein
VGVFSLHLALPDSWHNALVPLQTLCGTTIPRRIQPYTHQGNLNKEF